MMRLAFVMLALLPMAVGHRAEAANARNPYGNIDPRVDAGNDTGDWQVDRLNQQQLDRNYRGPYYPAPPAYPPPVYARPLYAAPPPYPPPAYASPPYAPPPYAAPPYAPPPYYSRPPYPPRY